jgi:hypothetical protein
MKAVSTSQIFAQLAGAIALVASVHAAAWNEQVTNACTHEGLNVSAEEIAICHAYMEGFLDGAITTDTAMIESVTKADSDESDFFKRAYMTRVGSNSRALPATALAHFCLPDGTQRNQVVTTIASAMPREPQPGSDVAQSLYNILKASYPCQ